MQQYGHPSFHKRYKINNIFRSFHVKQIISPPSFNSQSNSFIPTLSQNVESNNLIEIPDDELDNMEWKDYDALLECLEKNIEYELKWIQDRYEIKRQPILQAIEKLPK